MRKLNQYFNTTGLPLLLILASVFALIPHSSFAAKKGAKTPMRCSLLMQEMTESLKSYLSVLLTKKILKKEDVQKFSEKLRSGELVNPISQEKASLNYTLYIHREGLEENYFLEPKVKLIDQNELLIWLESALEEVSKSEVVQKKTQHSTKLPFRKMKFNRIPPGRVRIGDKEIEIAHSFEMTDTHITQSQWVEIMGENPSFFSTPSPEENPLISNLQINGKSVPLLPDNPVENVTWWSVLEFANRLSVREGLRPVYDLSGISFLTRGTAETGSKKEVHELNALKALKIISVDEKFTDTEGYRLPTSVEYEYVLTNLGESKTKYIFGDNEEELNEYAWYQLNSGFRTHPVASKKAFKVDGKNFYDLHGNVVNWIWGWFEDKSRFAEKRTVPAAFTVGGSCSSEARFLTIEYLKKISPSSQNRNHGFRLVRTLRDSK